MKNISRREFLKGAAALAGTVAASGVINVSAAEEAAGVCLYAGTARGLKDDVTVAVKLAEDGEILEVAVLEKGDSPFISDAAVESITKQMVEQQSFSVEALSGATFTSFGIMQAARNAVAGLPDAERYDKDVEYEYTQAEDVECDIVIVGGGASGLCAAVAAKTDDKMSGGSDSGLKVMVIEQLGYTGGSFRVADSMVIAFNNSRYNEATGASSTTDAAIEYVKANPYKEGCLNEELFRKILDNGGMATSQLLDNGLWMPVSDARPGVTFGGLPVASWTVRDMVQGKDADTYDGMDIAHNAGGPYVSQSLLQMAKNAGAEIRVSTKVLELEVADGELKGLKVEDKANHVHYTIRAKKYILATGCIGNSSERMAKYAPWAEGAVHFGCAGTNGDVQVWVEENGGVVLEGKTHYQPGVDGRLGQYGPTSQLTYACPCIMVNLEGKRFFNDAKRARAVCNTTYIKQPEKKVFGIVSGEAAARYRKQLDYAVDHDVAWVADSIEELAELAGINKEGLVETVKAYNEAYKAGKDVEFEVKNAEMTPIAENGPYYAFINRALHNLTDTGVKVDVNFQPVKPDGSVLFANAYACGSLMVMNYNVMTGGMSHLFALTSGVLAGREVKNSLL